MKKALYATNVYHYDHVLLAMKQLFDEVGLVKRLELTPESLARLTKMHVPRVILDIISRRVREVSTIPDFSSSLGIAQLANPLSARMGIPIGPAQSRMINSQYAGQVEKQSRNYDVLHFIEGLGYKALAKNSFQLTICERRNFHHEVFEEQIDLLDGFPLNGRRDPIADVLDYEYAESDYIFVYSNAVKLSFLSRGFQDSKIKVVPIGIGPQLDRLRLQRDPTQLIFVGRGDPSKGLDVAVATVKSLGRAFRLKVAGPMSPAVRKWLSRQQCVEYVGILNRMELRELYSSSAAMLLPSTESFGLAAAEAVYHGLPLICSDKTGIAEYLPPVTRTQVYGRDPAVWAAAVEAVLVDWKRNEAESLTTVADAFRDLSWASTAKRTREAYESVLRDVSARPPHH